MALDWIHSAVDSAVVAEVEVDAAVQASVFAAADASKLPVEFSSARAVQRYHLELCPVAA